MIRTTLLCSLMLTPVSAASARQDPPTSPEGTAPMVVTSDTDAYCQSLSQQIGARGEPLPHSVASLRDQGRQLCATGQVRSGINRLRRALMVLRDPDGDGEQESDR